MTKEQFNLHGRNHKLKDDNHDSRIFEQPPLEHKRDNTLQQYMERYVKQCNSSITLTKQYFNNTLSVNISDNKDIKSIFKVWSTKHYPYSCIVYDCSSYKQDTGANPCAPLVWDPVKALDIRFSSSQFRKQHP
ncbi:unnamed protein product [Schistosoma curassoni]|uniref:SCP domain-containing protein n=1 Tax=Schistosoma curassoni TaxID=6186 RepID=A0A183KFW6_9TREM|nr:unnamed protein product [Schistosoma curassoni]